MSALTSRWMAAGFVVAACAAVPVVAQTPRAVHDEGLYAKVIENVADSAIHRLDFFPARAQTRVQLLFLSAGDSISVLFADLNRRSLGAAVAVDQMIGRLGTTLVPDDLQELHAQLLSALAAARAALDRLAIASASCQMSVSSVQRCQSPFTSATSALASAYKRYVETRVKIREQIRDTQTELPEFRKPA
ncbi:MAG: hypothetical protein ACREPM_00440 [Gemmatimonadaceae bacterium]